MSMPLLWWGIFIVSIRWKETFVFSSDYRSVSVRDSVARKGPLLSPERKQTATVGLCLCPCVCVYFCKTKKERVKGWRRDAARRGEKDRVSNSEGKMTRFTLTARHQC